MNASSEPILQPLDRDRAGRRQARRLRAGRQRLREARHSRQPPGRLALRRRRRCSRRRSSSACATSRTSTPSSLIGHRSYEEDVKLAQTVPGIDVILGTHSHRKEDLKQIPGTSTWIISPFQYLEYVSRLELTLRERRARRRRPAAWSGWARTAPRRPTSPSGSPACSATSKPTRSTPRASRSSARPPSSSSDANISTGESVLGNWVQDTVRAAAGAHLAVSTASSFRAAIPPGDVTVEDYLTAVPYKNLVLVHEMTGAQVQQLLD